MPKLLLSLLALCLPLAAPLAAQQVPRKVGDLTIKIPGGKPLSLAAYKGKPVVLAFILTSCSHCQHAVDLLSNIQPAYAPRGLEVLASAIDQNAPMTVPLFVRYMHPPFPVGFDDSNVALDFAGYSSARLPHMPIMLFIDRQGMVRQQHEGAEADYFGDQEEQNFRKSIDELMTPAKTALGKTTGATKKTH